MKDNKKRLSPFVIAGIALAILLIVGVGTLMLGVTRMYNSITQEAVPIVKRVANQCVYRDYEAELSRSNAKENGGSMINRTFTINSVNSSLVYDISGSAIGDSNTRQDIDPTVKDHVRLHLVSISVAEGGLQENDSTIRDGSHPIETGIFFVNRHDPDVVNILAVGLDSDSGNSDCDFIALFSSNKVTGSVRIVEFHGSTIVNVNGIGNMRLKVIANRLGIAALVNTINANFGLDIQDYMTVNISSAVSIADYMEGITMQLTYDEFDYIENHSLSAPSYVAGNIYKLNGEQLLNYAMYKEDGSFARMNRQLGIIRAVLRTIKEMNVPDAYNAIAYACGCCGTNMSFADLTQTLRTMLATDLSANGMIVPVSGSYSTQTVDGAFVISIDFVVNKNAVTAFIR